MWIWTPNVRSKINTKASWVGSFGTGGPTLKSAKAGGTRSKANKNIRNAEPIRSMYCTCKYNYVAGESE